MPRVLLIMLDGLRPDAITPERTPNLTAAIARGSSTLTARSVLPSITLPCHMSIFHSVPPGRHGILSNQYVPMARPIVGLFEAANDAGKLCASVTNWEYLRDLSPPEALDLAIHLRSSYDLERGDHMVVDYARPLIESRKYDLMFVYLGTIDTSGHLYGWMSDGYLEQVARVDALVGQIVAATPDDVVTILHADHGGHDRNHGTDSPEDMTIPWMIFGPGIPAGHPIERAVSLLDTAPTIARLLGFAPPRDWEGSAVDEV